MKKPLYAIDEEVLIHVEEHADYNLVSGSPDRIRENGKVVTVRNRTESGSNWYYKLNGVRDRDTYFHEKMLQPANLSPEELETRFIRGQISFDSFNKIKSRTEGERVQNRG